MATSATDLIVPVGVLLWLIINPLTLFFIFLWRGADGKIAYASILALVLSVLSFALGVTQQPILWIYDNQTTVFTSQYLVPQGQGVDLYGLLLIYHSFLIIVAVIKLMFSTHLLGQEDTS